MSLQLCWSLFCIKHLIYFYFDMACRISPIPKSSASPMIQSPLVGINGKASKEETVLGCGLHAGVASEPDLRGALWWPHLPTPAIYKFPHLHSEEVHKTFSYLLPPGLTWAVRLRGGIFYLRRGNSCPAFLSRAGCPGSQRSPCTNSGEMKS